MDLGFCDSKHIEAPLITSLTIDTICLFLQLTLLTFSVYHHTSTNCSQRQLARLSLFCQFMSIIWLVHSILVTDLEPLFFEIEEKTSFYCQMNWVINSSVGMGYYLTLIVFWAWRLQKAFSTTTWKVSKTLVKVRSKKHTHASMCVDRTASGGCRGISIWLVEERERVSLCLCVCRFTF